MFKILLSPPSGKQGTGSSSLANRTAYVTIKLKIKQVKIMRPNEMDFCAHLKYFLRPNEMPMRPNEMRRTVYI